jgi:Na+/proline symporter
LSYLNAWIIMGLGSIPQQDVYQRAMSAKTARISSLASLTGGIAYFIFALIPVFMALAARAMHPELLDINPQYFLPIFIMEHADIFTQSLFFGGLIAAILSTASGALLAASSLLAENVVTMFYRPPSDKARLWLIRHVLLVVALLSLGLGFYQGYIYELVSSAYSISLVGAFIPLIFGLYCSRAQASDCMISSVCGISVWLSLRVFGSEDFIMPAPLGGFLASLAGMTFSLFLKSYLPKTRQI